MALLKVCKFVIIKLNQQNFFDKLVRYQFVRYRTNCFYENRWLFNNILRRGLKVKPYNKESFIRKLNQLNIDCARSWQSPTYLVCCGWLHDVPPMLLFYLKSNEIANLHLAGSAPCRFVQICLNHCKLTIALQMK